MNSPSSPSLVYVHTTRTFQEFPTYFFDHIYQVSLIHGDNPIPIYILTHKGYFSTLQKILDKMNISSDFLQNIHLIPVEELDVGDYSTLRTTVFATDFFLVTFTRFLYIQAWMEKYSISNVFHIEYDVMLYTHINHIYQLLRMREMHTKLVYVQDSPMRALASLMFIPSYREIGAFNDYALNYLSQPNLSFQNEMMILGLYPSKFSFPNDMTDENLMALGYYDGAALGQYLGGVDPRNLKITEGLLNPFVNPSIGFINETSTFKPNTVDITTHNRMTSTESLKFYFITKPINSEGTAINIPIHTLHIHSKLLYDFSSKFNMRYTELISGDLICSMCDMILCLPENVNFHKNLTRYNKNIVLINMDLNYTALITKLEELKQPVRIGVYTHTMYILYPFLTKLSVLAPSLRVVVYSHNSDHPLTDSMDGILNISSVERVYSQNPSTWHSKLRLLPIGIANSMWPHGDLQVLFRVMTTTYYLRKTRSIYVYISGLTHPYRSRAHTILSKSNMAYIQPPLPFEDYLAELARHRFALCIRGNGIDTHRFWEALYLGVIPVIVNNTHTDMTIFVAHLKRLDVPFYVITHFSEFCSSHTDTFFSETLYGEIMERHPNYLEKLKLSYYFKDKPTIDRIDEIDE